MRAVTMSEFNDFIEAVNMAIDALENLPSAELERWSTCFDCPLSQGCPVIKGCTNEQAMQYAGEIPDNCPLNKISAEPERKKGKWNRDGEIPNTCSVCGEDWDKYVEGQDIWYTGEIPNFCPNCGSYNGGEEE